jgi:uncharacterized protein YkwD/uncharacterized membrane protein required for colicin V production
MNAVDLLLLLIVALGAWHGWRRGFLRCTAELAAFVAAVLIALWYSLPAAAYLDRWGLVKAPWAAPAAFLLLLVLGRVLLDAGVRWVASPARPGAASMLDRSMGVLPGTMTGLVNAAIVAMVLLAGPFGDSVSKSVQSSALALRLAAPADWLEARLGPIFEPAISRAIGKFTVAPPEDALVELPFVVTDARPRPDLEAAMLVLLNEERRKHGLRPLKADPQALETARAHSADMFARSYFSHITPDGRTPFDRMRHSGLRFMVAGENLALSKTVPLAHQGLMNSPGHRANILRPAFGRVAIGVLDGGRHGLMVTQTFRN